MTERGRLDGQVAFVTGAGGGIGRAIALGLAAAGADVALFEIIPERAEEAAARIAELGRQALILPGDAMDAEALRSAIAATDARFGRLDILVNNAGGSPATEAATASPRFFDSILKLNLHAPMYMAQAAYPHMVAAGGGNVINIASVSGIRPSPGTAAYGAAKAGLLNLTQSLAQEWGPHGVRVNAIIAGLMQTETAETTYGDAEAQAAVGRSMPLGRMGLGSDLAGAVLWLCSDLASWVSGARINVDGGGERPYFLDLVKGN